MSLCLLVSSICTISFISMFTSYSSFCASTQNSLSFCLCFLNLLLFCHVFTFFGSSSSSIILSTSALLIFFICSQSFVFYFYGITVSFTLSHDFITTFVFRFVPFLPFISPLIQIFVFLYLILWL